MLGDVIEFRAVGADVDLRALRAWLGREDDLHGRVELAGQPLKPHQMGGTLDAVTVAVGGGGIATVAVRSVFVWLAQRQQHPHISMTLRDPHGRKAEVEIDDLHDFDSVIEKVLQFFPEVE